MAAKKNKEDKKDSKKLKKVSKSKKVKNADAELNPICCHSAGYDHYDTDIGWMFIPIVLIAIFVMGLILIIFAAWIGIMSACFVVPIYLALNYNPLWGLLALATYPLGSCLFYNLYRCFCEDEYSYGYDI